MNAAEIWLMAAVIFTAAAPARDAYSLRHQKTSGLNMFDDYDYGEDLDYKDECGIPGIQPNIYFRIVGGVEAEPHSWPWHVKIKILRSSGRYSLICGGALIEHDWVVTAAHCVYNTRKNHLKVVLGDFDRSVYEGYAQMTAGVKEVIVHPGYVGMRTHWRHDIAVLKLDTFVKYTKYIRPACLPWHSCEDDIANCYVTGWGKDSTHGRPQKRLHQCSMNYYPNDVCNQPDWYDNLVCPTMLCAGHGKGGMGTCQGDSGGPLACLGRDGTHWTLEGVISWARGGCASPHHPTIFTRICSYVDWIQEVMIGNDQDYDYYEYDGYY